MHQIGFSPAGCLFWFKNTLDCNKDYFAYCSTTTIYIYDINTFKCEKMIAVHDKTITSISWNKIKTNIIACCGVDTKIHVWDLFLDKPLHSISMASIANIMEWHPTNENLLLVSLFYGEIRVYSFHQQKPEKKLQIDYFGRPKIVRWNKAVDHMFIAGGESGKVLVHNTSTNKSLKSEMNKHDVEDIRWDPNSQFYALVAFKNGDMDLIDSETLTVLHKFEKQSGGINSICWIKCIPGGFITASEKGGAIKSWSASSKAPSSSIKINSSGVINMLALNDTPLDGSGVLLTFVNNSVGVYDQLKKKLLFVTESNHSETIFDMELHPMDKDLMATSSFDGTIKIWNVFDMRLIQTLTTIDTFKLNNYENLKHHIYYGISWASFDKDLLASVNSQGILRLWSVSKSKVLQEIKTSGKAVHRISWSILDPSYIATGSTDESCYIYIYDQVNRKCQLSSKIKHPKAVYGVAWHSSRSKILATGCADGIVRIYQVAEKDCKLMNALKGHKERVFNVMWNPIFNDILASGSDDKTVRIWDINSGSSFSLEGHTNKVRPLSWNHEFPHLLVTGSWDSTIRVWNVLERKTLKIVTEHSADIYGITSHKERPFIYFTCSRDNSLRRWDLESLTEKIQMRLLLKVSWSECIGEEKAFESVKQDFTKLYGEESRKLEKSCTNQPANDIKSIESIMKFFSFYEGESDFWEILKSIKTIHKQKGSLIDENLAVRKRKAERIETSLSNFSYDHKSKTKDKQAEAALLYLQSGEFEKFCEILIKQGKWEKAISFAPTVSHSYWLSLVKRYADSIIQSNNEEACFYYILSNQTYKAIKNFSKQGDYDDAKLLSSLLKSKKIMKREANELGPQEINHTSDPIINNKLNYIVALSAEENLKNGFGLKAATQHISLNDPESAVKKLTRANLVLYAWALSRIMNLKITDGILKFLMMNKILHYKEFELLEKIVTDSELMRIKIFIGLDQKLNKPGTTANFEKMDLSEKEIENFSDSLLNSGDYGNLIEFFLFSFRNCFKNRKIELLPAILSLSNKLSYIKGVNELLSPEIKNELLIYMNYLGLKKAIWLGFADVVANFYKNIKHLFNLNKSSCISLLQIKKEYLSFLRFKSPVLFLEEIKQAPVMDESNDPLIRKMRKSLEIIGSQKEILKKGLLIDLNRNSIITDSCNNPLNINKATSNKTSYNVSSFSGKPIKAEGYILEDNTQYLNFEEALMWSICNPFSPLNSGSILNPH